MNVNAANPICYGYLCLHMGLFDWLFPSRRKPGQEASQSMDEVAEAALLEDYADARDNAAESAFDELNAPDEAPLSTEVVKQAPVDFDVGDAEAEDLFDSDTMVSHYEMDTDDSVDLADSDTHLKQASIDSPAGDGDAYSQVEVPLGDDDMPEDLAKLGDDG
jgi:hypothetical protein